MTIQTEKRVSELYEGDGETASFPFSFKVFNATTDITAYQSTGEGSEIAIDGTLYRVVLNADQDQSPGGTVVFDTAPEAGLLFRFVSTIPYLQKTELTNFGAFKPETLNEVHDKLCAQIQQVRALAERALVVPYTQDKTPEEVLAEVLDIAATANDYVKKAEEIYESVKDDVSSVKGMRDEIDTLAKTFADIEQLTAEALANKNATDDNLLAIQQLKDTVENFISKAAYSYRATPTILANETVPLSNLSPATFVKAGDHVLSLSSGELFRIVSVTSSSATVGEVVGTLKGPKGDQGEPGPAGEKGPTGDMGQSPFATCFGQFRVDERGDLNVDYVGFEAPATFTINENGEVLANAND